MNAETPITYVTADGAHVVVPWREDLATLIPHGREIPWQGSRMLVIPNRHDECKLARNLGVAVPSPILTRYDWCGSKPWDIQRTTAALLTESHRAYVLSEMGTGKTRSVLYAADYLMRTKQAKRMLIVAPLSTLTPTWEREIFNLMFKHNVRVLHGSREKRLKLLAEGSQVCITNHHGLRVLGDHVVKAGFDIAVLDELAVFRNKSTELWKAAHRLLSAPSVRYVWGLTGSPTPNAPTDAWAQVRLLTPTRTVRTMRQFKDLTMREINSFRWVPRPEANQIVHEAMSPSVRHTRDDVMELPACTFVDRAVTLDTDAANAYKIMWKKARLLMNTGESVTALNEGIVQNKLLQISCGYLYTDKKTVYALPAKGRLDALDEVLAETDRKVIVLVPFLHALTGVATHLRAKGHDIAVVHGGTTRPQRDKIFTSFQNEATPRIIVAHPQTLAHGLTLTEAATIIWYSPTTSNEIYEQANARINRPGQVHKTLIVHMVGTPVERATYVRLRSKGKMQGALLDLFKQQELAF